MKRSASALFITLISSCFSLAQNNVPCEFDIYLRKNVSHVKNAEEIITRKLSSSVQNRLLDTIKTIPVVVHVIHTGGAENISAAQIQSQIDVLNEDYRKVTGTNGDGPGSDTGIEFCLAKRTPDGECTDGIVRIQSSLSNHQTYQRGMLSDLSFWDNTRYLNIYVVKSINGSSSTAGYSSFPGGPADEDGIVVRHNYFGRMGTAVSGTNGRTMTHEIGHWLGLYHTFNGGCGTDTCLDGDLVCDTPPAAAPNYSCSVVNSCSNDFPDVNDQVSNYMDYSGDLCKNMFSEGQKMRMQASLSSIRYDIWQQWNIDSTGCDSSYVSPACNVLADFTSNTQNICVGNPVIFTNRSLNTPLSWQWYFPGGSPSSSTAVNPVVSYSTLGSYDVKLVVYGSSGTDSIIQSNYINVSSPPIGQALPYFEGFETNVFPPNGITIDNPDNGITWERDTIAQQYSGSGSCKINNLINTNYGQSDAILLPGFDFTSFAGVPYLNFKWAYARSDASYSDEMIVLVSNDCGVNWVQKLYRTGSTLVTGPTQVTPYIPDNTTVWKTANINLGTYSTSTNVLIKIVNVTDGGNNLYIDNINLGQLITGLENEESHLAFKLFPNPASNEVTLEFELEKNQAVSYEITDISGRLVLSKDLGEKLGPQQSSISLGDLSSGLYFIKLKAGANAMVTRLLIH